MTDSVARLQFFIEFSIPDEKDGVHILRTADGRSAGEAYVQFATADGVHMAGEFWCCIVGGC
jgi:hypothetical protein